MFRQTLACALIAATLASSGAVGLACEEPRVEPAIASLGSAIVAARAGARGEWLENGRLPYRGEWLDVPTVLGSLTQQDHLRSTRHDDEKCGAMMALAAAIAGGPARFEALLTRLEKKARGRDRAALAEARGRFGRGALTAGDLHRVSEVLYRQFVGGRDGSTDGDISKMIRAGGWKRVETGARTPAALLDELKPGECFPLNIYDELPDYTGWHVVLVWKDAAGVARVYDSDRDLAGSQVTVRGTARFREMYLEAVAPASRIRSEWIPGTKFTAPD